MPRYRPLSGEQLRAIYETNPTPAVKRLLWEIHRLRAVVLRADDFTGLRASEPGETQKLPATGLRFEDLERDLVAQALERTGWNKAAAAALLGVNRDWVRYRIERHGLQPGNSPGVRE